MNVLDAPSSISSEILKASDSRSRPRHRSFHLQPPMADMQQKDRAKILHEAGWIVRITLQSRPSLHTMRHRES
jgi:hypothetical protein